MAAAGEPQTPGAGTGAMSDEVASAILSCTYTVTQSDTLFPSHYGLENPVAGSSLTSRSKTMYMSCRFLQGSYKRH